MGVEHRVARAMLDETRRTFMANVEGLTLEELLDAAGGYRSILGLAKHTAGWTAVYHSYAFDAEPRSWDRTDWPRGLRERIDPTSAYAEEILAWLGGSCDRWSASIEAEPDLEVVRPLHWGESAPLHEIVAMAAEHISYHAGEINMILAIRRAEAWEVGEQVEENHIDTTGHLVRPAWMTEGPA